MTKSKFGKREENSQWITAVTTEQQLKKPITTLVYAVLKVLRSFLQTFVPVKLRIISSLSVMAICLLIRKNFANFFAHVEKRIWRKQLVKWLQCWGTFTILDLPWLDWSLATKLFCFSSHLVDVKCCSQTKNNSTNKCAVSFMACAKCLIARAVLNTCAKLKKHVQSVSMHVKYVVLLIWELKKKLVLFCLLKLSKTRAKKCIVFLLSTWVPKFCGDRYF